MFRLDPGLLPAYRLVVGDLFYMGKRSYVITAVRRVTQDFGELEKDLLVSVYLEFKLNNVASSKSMTMTVDRDTPFKVSTNKYNSSERV